MIIDIDFRFVKRVTVHRDNSHEWEEIEHVFQWKKKVMFEGQGPDGGFGRYPQWTDWQDVRTEEE